MNNQQENVKLEYIKKMFGEPVFIGFSDYVLKLRRNLVALSFTIIFYKWSGINIVTIFGLDCSSVERYKIDIALLGYLTYSLLHFLFEAWETYLRWIIRLSGVFTEIQKPPQTLDGIKYTVDLKDDNSNEPQFIQDCAKLEYRQNISYEQSYFYNIILQLLMYNKEKVVTKEAVSKLTLQFISECTQESLKRFRKNFRQFQLSQIIKFFTFDTLIPILLALFALSMLIRSIISNDILSIIYL